jgi:hypothetical protein
MDWDARRTEWSIVHSSLRGFSRPQSLRFQPLLKKVQNWMFREKRALWSARENFIGVITDIDTGINDISIKINPHTIKPLKFRLISIVWVSEHFSKMLVLSGVFNTRTLGATNYANQDYVHVNLHTYIYLHYTNQQPIKKCFKRSA